MITAEFINRPSFKSNQQNGKDTRAPGAKKLTGHPGSGIRIELDRIIYNIEEKIFLFFYCYEIRHPLADL